MKFATYIQKRRRRYLAQVLGAFERTVEPHLPPSATDDVKDFKGLVRMRMNALAVDAANAHEAIADDMPFNGAAEDIRDRIADRR